MLGQPCGGAGSGALVAPPQAPIRYRLRACCPHGLATSQPLLTRGVVTTAPPRSAWDCAVDPVWERGVGQRAMPHDHVPRFRPGDPRRTRAWPRWGTRPGPRALGDLPIPSLGLEWDRSSHRSPPRWCWSHRWRRDMPMLITTVAMMTAIRRSAGAPNFCDNCMCEPSGREAASLWGTARASIALLYRLKDSP